MKPEKKTLWEEWQWLFWLILIAFLAKSCSNSGGGADGPVYPLNQTNEAAEYQAEMMEMEQDYREYDPAMEYDNQYNPPDEDFYGYPDIDSNTLALSCPAGCAAHVDGCDIKGNISIDGVKIYHLPGQEYYAVTRINPTYGERWFCTESEARANGWRKSKK